MVGPLALCRTSNAVADTDCKFPLANTFPNTVANTVANKVANKVGIFLAHPPRVYARIVKHEQYGFHVGPKAQQFT